MIKNYILVALRTLRRQRVHTAINIVGLAVGMACCIFLLLFVRDELSYDRFHEDADSIHRVNMRIGDGRQVALTPTIAAPWLEREIPEVVAATRVEKRGGLVSVGDQVFDESDFLYVDSTFFDVFTFPILVGDGERVLHRPNMVLLTQSTARKYFGEADPIGQRIIRNNEEEYVVTGIVADAPSNSHIQFDLLASFASRTHWANNEMWSSANFFTYVRLNDAAAAEAVQASIDGRITELAASGEEPRWLQLQPLTSIHLRSDVLYELDAGGSMSYVMGFGALAILVLLIACINYMNIATARSTLRSKEIGLRKSLGAVRSQLAGQFYGEAAILALGALLVACILVAIGLPAFNQLAGKDFSTSALLDPGILSLILGVFVVVALVAGSYPAVFLSRVEPIRALRGRMGDMKRTTQVRRALVIVQFAISAFLIVTTLVVVSQVRYMQNRELGFDQDHVVELALNDPDLYRSFAAIRDALESSPSIVAASAVSQIPGQIGWTDMVRSEGMSDDDEFSIKGLPSEAGVIEALGIEVIAGRDFGESPPMPDTANHQFLLNETLVRQLGWTPQDAVGRRLISPRVGEVIGVVRDFNFNTLHVPIEPLAIWYGPTHISRVVARTAPGQTDAALRHIRETWAGFAPDVPFTYRFIDDVYNQQYEDERRMSAVLSIFAALAIFVACLGLLGLAAFVAEKRTREIGVRKVLGASVPGIVGLLSRDFLLLVGVAFVAAAPLTWIAARNWLGGFAYQVDVGVGVFVLAGAVILLIALATVSTQAIRAARANPVESLRYE